MSIRVFRNENGNCVNFEGTSNPVYWNACLSGEVDVDSPDTINIINDVRTAQEDTTIYEFYRIPYTEFEDRDGNTFASAQECADYITQEANVLGNTGTNVASYLDFIDVQLDETHTTILMDSGDFFPVNTIKAIVEDGAISIKSIKGGKSYYTGLVHTNLTINGNALATDLNTVVNQLNALFTVNAPVEPIVGTIPVVTANTTITAVNGAVLDVSENHINFDVINADAYTNETISAAGEYFQFQQDVNITNISFGLVDATTTINSGFTYTSAPHLARFRSDGSIDRIQSGWLASTDYSSAYLYTYWKLGIGNDGYLYLKGSTDGNTYGTVLTSKQPLSSGTELRMVIAGYNGTGTWTNTDTIEVLELQESDEPTLEWSYIESPDGSFYYPLFPTAEQANWVDSNNGGSGTSHTHVFVDDTSGTTWYMPDSLMNHAQGSAPTVTSMGGVDNITWNTISTDTDALYAPTAYTDNSLSVDEGGSVNLSVTPADVSYTTTVNGLPTGLSYNSLSGNITGTAPEVSGDTSTNASDDYSVSITRTNSYGSSTGTLTITVNNLTQPLTTVSGYSVVTGSVTNNVMAEGSVYHLNHNMADQERLVIPQLWIEENILPYLLESGDKYVIGIEDSGADFTTFDLSDMDAAIVWEYVSASQHKFSFYRDNVPQHSTTINSATDAYYDYAIEIDGTSAWLIACNVNNISNEPSPSEGGVFSHTYEVTNYDTTDSKIHFGVIDMEGGLDIGTGELSTIDTPAAPSNATAWTKALDFSGASEYAVQVNTSNAALPLKMGGINNQVVAPSTAGNTSNDTNARPWATAVVFKIDGNSSNQHIWNLGEGAGSTDDNIYLRVDANRGLYFGWGRQGDLNELFFGSLNVGTWYGCYIGHNGTRYGSGNTAAQLADAFDVRLYSDATNWQSASAPNSSTPTMWGLSQSTVGGRMNRQYQGDFTIGGRGANRNFHGKVASMVVTTLRRNVAMPDTTEIEMMIKDPIKWIDTYKEGQTFRYPATTQESTFTKGSTLGYAGTQVWLMGDGTSDSYANGIRNEVLKTDQNWTKLQLNSMVSNDIENITISGLS